MPLTAPCRRPGLPLLSACLGLALSGMAHAQSSPWYLGVSQNLVHESNIYRVGGGLSLPASASKSDTISGTALVGGIDQTIGRQRVFGSVTARANRFSSNKALDNESYNLNLGLDWSTVNRLSGSVTAAYDQNLTQFNERTALGEVVTRPNQLQVASLDTKVRLGVVTRVTLEAGLGWRERRYSASSYDSEEYTQTSLSLGGRYRHSGALSSGVALRVSHARYPRFRVLAGGGFESDTQKREDIDLTAFWQISGASSLNLRISPTRVRYDRNDAGNFSGITGAATWTWQATGKTRLSSVLSRDTGQSAEGVSLGIFGTGVSDESRITTALNLRANHELTGKINLTASLTHASRSLRNTVSFADGTPIQEIRGSDRTSTLSLGARWLPTRSSQVGCDISHERRSASGGITWGYNAAVFSCYGQLVLQ